VLPSLSDSFSLATLEAMACGLPVIVSRETGIADLISDGRQGYVVPSRDAESIREKLHFLYETPDIRRTMGTEASIAARRQTWDRYAEEAVGIYRRIHDSRETMPLKSVYAAETRS
jgi:glycosyltransferase involved in cell wall biosynthesis